MTRRTRCRPIFIVVRIQIVLGKVSISSWGGVHPGGVLVHGLTILATGRSVGPIGGKSEHNALYPCRVIIIVIDNVVPIHTSVPVLVSLVHEVCGGTRTL